MLGDVLKLASSRGMIIGISLITTPLLTRSFPPNAYGILGVLTTIASMLSSFASLNYIDALPLATTNDERRDLFTLSSLILILSTATLSILGFFYAEPIASTFGQPALVYFLPLLPLVFMGSALKQFLDTLLSCQRQYGAVAARNVLESVLTRAVQLGICAVGYNGSTFGLLFGTLIGTYAAAVAAGLNSVTQTLRMTQTSLKLSSLLSVASKHRKFPLVTLWTDTINAVTFGLPTMVLAKSASVTQVGLYTMAYSIVSLPASMFGAAASRVFYIECADLLARGQPTAETTDRLMRLLAMLTPFPLASVLYLGPLLFEVVLGAHWREAGSYAQILMPFVATMVFSSPLVGAFQSLGRQGEWFLWNLLLLGVRFTSLWLGALFYGPEGALALYSASNVLILTKLITRLLTLLGSRPTSIAVHIAKMYLQATFLLLPAIITYWAFHYTYLSLVLLATAALLFVATHFRRASSTSQTAATKG